MFATIFLKSSKSVYLYYIYTVVKTDTKKPHAIFIGQTKKRRNVGTQLHLHSILGDSATFIEGAYGCARRQPIRKRGQNGSSTATHGTT